MVVYSDEGSSPPTPRTLTFHLRSNPQAEADLASLTVDASNLEHNDPIRFSFPPQPDSEGKTYYVFLEAPQGSETTVWCSTFDAYGEGTMYLSGQPGDGDLRFKTYYDYNLASMARDVWRGLLSEGWLILPLLAVFALPGYLLHSLLSSEPESDPLEHLALVVGLSLALAPLALLVLSVLGVVLNATRVLIAVAALGVAALWRLASTDFRDLKRWLHSPNRPAVSAFLFIFVVSLLVRLLQIRNLVVPAWVDSVHHTLITQLIVSQGGAPQSYEPLLPIGEFVYHFGFHSLIAAFHWLTGLEITRAMLVVGQVLNALMVLSAYLLVKRLTRRRLAGLFGALIVGVISTMPAYYVSWGRYTQLAGLALLPAAIALTMRALGQSDSNLQSGVLWSRAANLLLAAISVAGLALTHYRVLIFYGCFLLAYLLRETVGTYRTHRAQRSAVLRYWSRAAMMCLLAALLTLPWFINLARALLPLATLPARMRGAPSYNVVPYDLIFIGHNRGLMALSIGGLLWGLYKRERAVILTVLWVALVVVIANPTILGFPSTWLVNNASLAISLFVPLAILAGYFLAAVCCPMSARAGVWRWMLAAIIVLVALWGAWKMLSIVNPDTVLATRDDVAAMDWIRSHVPPDAKFLINVRHWQGGTYVGTDGGYWIPLLTGRDTILPPAIYIYGSAEYVAGINDLAEEVAAMGAFDEAAEDFPRTRQLLYDSGVTHVYIGARGGEMAAGILGSSQVARSSFYRPIYSNGAVWVFEIRR